MTDERGPLPRLNRSQLLALSALKDVCDCSSGRAVEYLSGLMRNGNSCRTVCSLLRQGVAETDPRNRIGMWITDRGREVLRQWRARR